MAGTTPRRPSPPDDLPAGPLALILACPKCGAPFTVDDTAVTTTCAHCASRLLLSAPGRDEVYVAEEVIRGRDDLVDMLVEYRVQAHRAEIVDTHEDSGGPAAELFVQMRLAAYERSLREKVRILDAERIQVPYWQITGRIVQCVLGRQGDGPKVMRVRAFAVDHAVPGYDVEKANLRDRGLRLSASRARPLTVSGVREHGPFLPWLPVTPRSYRDIDKWKSQDLEPGIDAVARRGEFLCGRRLLVYRAYWLAHMRTDKGLEWILVDASFGTIAGYPDAAEVRTLLRQVGGDPLRSGGESYRRVSIVASRCPDCGFEARLDPRCHVVVCENCHLALEARPAGIEVVRYDHARRGDAATAVEYLPFWRFEARLDLPGAAASGSLEDYAKAVFPQGLPPGFRVRGRHLWVPGFRLLGTEIGDETFQSLAQRLHGDPPEIVAGKVPLGGAWVAWGASVAQAEAREIAPLVLFSLYGKAAAARLNRRLFASAVEQVKLTLSEGRLVMVPFVRQGEVLRDGIAPVPLLLLRGGPELEQQRATVQGAHAARLAASR